MLKTFILLLNHAIELPLSPQHQLVLIEFKVNVLRRPWALMTVREKCKHTVNKNMNDFICEYI